MSAMWRREDAEQVFAALRESSSVRDAGRKLGVHHQTIYAFFARHDLGRPLDMIRRSRRGEPDPPWDDEWEKEESDPADRPPDTMPSERHPPIQNPTNVELAGVRAFATPTQKIAIDAMLEHGSVERAAAACSIDVDALHLRLSQARHLAARRGWSPGHDMTKTAPDAFHVKGVSTYYDAEGNKRGQWVKTGKDGEHRVAQMLQACSALLEPLQGKAKPSERPQGTDADRLCVYPIGDHHHGLYAWADETGGDDHDISRSEQLLTGAMAKLLRLAPPASSALVINLGDFFHADNSQNRTARGGHALDVDTRYARVMRSGVRLMAQCIDGALEKHDRVRVICEIGNHDDHSALVLSMALDMFYSDDPRVEIDTSPAAFHWHRFDQNLIGVTHGDRVKLDRLPGIMAADRAEDWGQTKHRYWYTGHVHHQQVKEFPGCVVETFRTLSPRDAWAARAGYRSGRDMNVDVVHRTFGRVTRHTVGVEQLRGKK